MIDLIIKIVMIVLGLLIYKKIDEYEDKLDDIVNSLKERKAKKGDKLAQVKKIYKKIDEYGDKLDDIADSVREPKAEEGDKLAQMKKLLTED